MADEAAGKFEELKGKARGKMEELKGKAEGKKAENEGEAKAADKRQDDPVDKAADFINEKTDGKYNEKIAGAAEKVKKVAGKKDDNK